MNILEAANSPEFRKFLQNEIDADFLDKMAKKASASMKKKLLKEKKRLIDENKAELKRLKRPDGA